ncbi:hypothetical protein B0H14DRAFT_2599074 [Mycena olivaceomarginata]|nr:hypothetical protein B0H14DRAFT_2599074 [Mycena olivaceomarginata]
MYSEIESLWELVLERLLSPRRLEKRTLCHESLEGFRLHCLQFFPIAKSEIVQPLHASDLIRVAELGPRDDLTVERALADSRQAAQPGQRGQGIPGFEHGGVVPGRDVPICALAECLGVVFVARVENNGENGEGRRRGKGSKKLGGRSALNKVSGRRTKGRSSTVSAASGVGKGEHVPEYRRLHGENRAGDAEHGVLGLDNQAAVLKPEILCARQSVFRLRESLSMRWDKGHLFLGVVATSVNSPVQEPG